MKLTVEEINFLKLVERSPDVGDGWRIVSSQLWQLVNDFSRPELVEISGSQGDGRIRFSERGKIVVQYV